MHGDAQEVWTRGHRQALADVLEHGSRPQLERDVAQDGGRQVQQVGGREQQGGLVRGEVELAGEQQVRPRGSHGAERVQARLTHDHQGKPCCSRPRPQRGLLAALAGQPGAGRLRGAAQVEASNKALDDVARGQAGSEEHELGAGHIDIEHERDDSETRHGYAVEDDGAHRGVEVARAHALVEGARRPLE